MEISSSRWWRAHLVVVVEVSADTVGVEAALGGTGSAAAARSFRIAAAVESAGSRRCTVVEVARRSRCSLVAVKVSRTDW
jgi:hypothetical protein